MVTSQSFVRSPAAISTGLEYQLHHPSRARVRPRVHGIVEELDGQPAALVDEEVRELLFDVHLRLRDGLLVLTTAGILTGKRAPWGRAHDPAQVLAITNKFAASEVALSLDMTRAARLQAVACTTRRNSTDALRSLLGSGVGGRRGEVEIVVMGGV